MERFRCNSRERIPPRPKTQHGKLESSEREGERERGGGKVGHPGVPHFPISSLCVTSEYHFSFFPRGIKAVAENRGPPPRRDDLVIGWAEVSFSAPDIGNAR